MRVAYVDGRIPLRSELSTAQIDAECLAAMAVDHEIVAFVDSQGPGSDLVDAAGADVRISGKRPLRHGDLGRVSAEHALIRQLADLHESQPFDAVLVGDVISTDLSWYAPRLAEVPQLLVLGGPLVGRLRLVADDPELVRRHGREAWITASRIAAADGIVAGVPGTEMGLGSAAEAPPRYDLGGPIPIPADAVADSPDLVVVVATTEDRAGLGSLVERVAARVPMDAGTSLVVVVPNVQTAGEWTGTLVMAGCPDHLLMSTIVVPPGPDGVAAAFLRQADVVVAARPTDLAVHAVRSTCVTRPVILLDGQAPAAADPPAVPVVRRPPRTERVLVSFDGDREETMALLRAGGTAEAVVLHTTAGIAEATRLADSSVTGTYDVVVMGRNDAVTGQPSASELFPHAMAVHRRAVPSLLRRLPAAGDLWELIIGTVGLSLADRVRLGIVPAPVGREGVALPRLDAAGLPAWIGGTAVLPRFNLAGVDAMPAVTAPAPPAAGDDLRAWVKEHRWSDRARLALPWKWGLLGRAMRGRW